jgi:hypothetical protein
MRNSVNFQISVPLTASTQRELQGRHPEAVIEQQLKHPEIKAALKAEINTAHELGLLNSAPHPKGPHAKAEHQKAPKKGFDLIG